MTTAQKNAKAKFKQAIAYRQKTGVSLKEAFAHIYGKKKVGSVAKKTVKTKTVKKAKLTPDDKKDKSAFNAMARKYKKARVGALKLKPNEMRLGLLSSKVGATVKKKKSNKPSEWDILQKIHKVKKNVDNLDEAQHRHMTMSVSGIKKDSLKDYANNQLKIQKIEKSILGYQKMLKNPNTEKHLKSGFKTVINTLKLHLKEYKLHGKELKKHI
jgi:hypothetical protein